jgi:hypothetical protein
MKKKELLIFKFDNTVGAREAYQYLNSIAKDLKKLNYIALCCPPFEDIYKVDGEVKLIPITNGDDINHLVKEFNNKQINKQEA